MIFFLASSSASACITALVWSGVSITPSESSRVSFSGWSFGAVVVVMRPVALEGPSNHTDVLATFMPGAITPSRRDPLPDKFVRAARAPGWTIRKIVFEDQRVLLRLLDKISHWNCNAGARLPGPPCLRTSWSSSFGSRNALDHEQNETLLAPSLG